MRVLSTVGHDGAPSRLVSILATYTYTLPLFCVCVNACVRMFHLVPCPGCYIIVSNSSAGFTLHLFLAGAVLGGWSANRGSILRACEGWAGTRQANCNWGCVLSPSPSQLYAQGRNWEGGEGTADLMAH